MHLCIPKQSRPEMTAFVEQNPTFALLDNFNAREHMLDYTSCRTIDLPGHRYFPKAMAFAIVKDSPLIPHFNYHIRAMQERGTVDQVSRR